jgi:CSLREA domain-containing protein
LRFAAVAIAIALFAPAAGDAATVTVTSALDENAAAADNGTCTLREAISATNTDATVDTCVHDGLTGADTIQFQAALGAISLSITATSNENANANGDLDILAGNGLTITGPPAGQMVDAEALDRVVNLVSGTGLTKLENMTLTDGSANSTGGGISTNQGPLELEASAVSANTVNGSSGGGISVGNNSSLVLDDTDVTSNTINTTTTIALGAGIATGTGSPSPVSILNGSVVEGNGHIGGTNGGGGGVIGMDLTVTDSTISDNTAPQTGGGIELTAGGTLNVTGSTISGNLGERGNAGANAGGGGIRASTGTVTIDDSEITQNSIGTLAPAPGGGVDVNQGGTLTITDSLIEDNDATTVGGGVSVRIGATTIRRTVIADNDVADPAADGARGGGFNDDQPNGSLLMEDSLIDGNTVTTTSASQLAEAGGMNLNGTTNDVLRTTVSGNSLAGTNQRGGGAALFTDAANFTNVTFSGNLATGAGGDGGGLSLASSTANLSNTTFAANDAADLGDGIFGSGATARSSIVADGCSNAVTSVGTGNIQAPTATGACGLTPGLPGFIGGLQPNGGVIGPGSDPRPQLTQGIGFAGVAVDRVSGDCTDHNGAVIAEDERRIPRPFDAVPPAPAGCDSGAFELVTCAGATVDGPDAITGTAAGETLTGTTGADQIYGATGDDTLLGADGNDTICGAEGDDSLQGQVGGDRLSGGAGVDALDGGANTVPADTADFLDTQVGVSVNLAAGTASGEGADTLTAVEDIQGSRFDDVLTGDPGPNLIVAGTVSGTSGDDDILAGGAGTGPDGNDTYFGGTDPTSVDTVTYANRTDDLTISMATEPGNGGDSLNLENDTLNGVDNAVAGSGADLLIGSTGPNSLTGGPGADTLNADLGADQLFVRDGVADIVGCGVDNGVPDVDTVQTDEEGVDTLAQCQDPPDIIDFFVPPPPPPDGGGGTVTTPTPIVPAPVPVAPKKCKKAKKKKGKTGSAAAKGCKKKKKKKN